MRHSNFNLPSGSIKGNRITIKTTKGALYRELIHLYSAPFEMIKVFSNKNQVAQYCAKT